VIPLAGAAAAALLLLVLPPVYTERFFSLQSLSPTAQNGVYQDLSFRGRASEMLTGLAMFADHPLFGVGAGNYEVNYQEYTQRIGLEFRATERQAHSLYIQILSETGVLGGLAFLGIIVSLFSALGKTIRSLKNTQFQDTWLPWILSLRMAAISYLITSLFLHDAYIRYFWILVALCIAAIRISSQLREQTRHQTAPLEARR
jgi:O-antigen ligase